MLKRRSPRAIDNPGFIDIFNSKDFKASEFTEYEADGSIILPKTSEDQEQAQTLQYIVKDPKEEEKAEEMEAPFGGSKISKEQTSQHVEALSQH